jgi:alkanesulfonate monooxygenase SsuD/methylene tetrahydromethanopterin reductase-like flavin-dependent oxidoreductase (luciferase family)
VLIAYVSPRDRDRAQEFLSRLAALKKGQDLETLLVFGDDAALRERIEAFIAAGASKFVIVPLVAPSSWPDELRRLRDNVVRPVEGAR